MYIQLNSQILSYEKTGEGSPVILLHGNKEDHHIFDELTTTLAKSHTVYAIDSRGHGESATPKEYHYKDMAADVVNFIKSQELVRPYILGYSDGAIVALLVAMEHSSKLAGIVCCGANLSPSGLTHKTMHDIKKEYKALGDPRTLMMINEPDIKARDLASISVPAMIFAGEEDCVKEKETRSIADNIPTSTLYILEDESHSSYIVHTNKLAPYIKNFLR